MTASATLRASPRVNVALVVVTGPSNASWIIPAATSTVAAWSCGLERDGNEEVAAVRVCARHGEVTSPCAQGRRGVWSLRRPALPDVDTLRRLSIRGNLKFRCKSSQLAFGLSAPDAFPGTGLADGSELAVDLPPATRQRPYQLSGFW